MKAKLLCFGAKRQKILGIFGGDHLEKTVTLLEKIVTPLRKKNQILKMSLKTHVPK